MNHIDILDYEIDINGKNWYFLCHMRKSRRA